VCHKQKAQSLLKIHMPELTEKEIDTILEEYTHQPDPS